MKGRKNAPDPMLAVADGLARAQHALSLFEAGLHRQSGSGLTAPQARVVFCLGGTDGLTCSEITERTLITKGTLTGVIDRLEEKGLVQRWGDTDDGRRIIVDLTRLGERLYRREFPPYAAAMRERLADLSDGECTRAARLLDKLARLYA